MTWEATVYFLPRSRSKPHLSLTKRFFWLVAAVTPCFQLYPKIISSTDSTSWQGRKKNIKENTETEVTSLSPNYFSVILRFQPKVNFLLLLDLGQPNTPALSWLIPSNAEKEERTEKQTHTDTRLAR